VRFVKFDHISIQFGISNNITKYQAVPYDCIYQIHTNTITHKIKTIKQ